MKLALLFFVSLFCSSLVAQEATSDPFEASKPKPFKREDVKSLVIETNTRQVFSALKSASEYWVKEEVVITDREIIERWTDLYKTEEKVNDEARNQYYIGEPVLCHVLLRDREDQTIRWFPIGLPGLKSPIPESAELSAKAPTLFGKEVVHFLQEHRPHVIKHYVRSSSEAAKWQLEMGAKAETKQPIQSDTSH